MAADAGAGTTEGVGAGTPILPVADTVDTGGGAVHAAIGSAVGSAAPIVNGILAAGAPVSRLALALTAEAAAKYESGGGRSQHVLRLTENRPHGETTAS